MTRLKALAGLAATLVLALPGMSAAQTLVAPPQPAQSDTAGQDLVAWLSEVATLGQQYSAIMDRRVDTLMWMMEEPAQLLDLLDAGDKPAARAWATRWAAQARTRLASEVEAFGRLPSQIPAFPTSIPLDAQQEARFRNIRQQPALIGALLTTTGESSEAYVRLVEAAASGQPEDLIRLSKGIMTLIAAQLEAENTMLEGLRTDPSAPTHHFATAQIESNKALIVMLRHQQATILEQASDPALAAGRIRGHAVATRQAAADMRRTTDVFEGRLAAMGTATDPVPEVFTMIVASLHDSAAVEVRMGNELDVLAGAVARNDQTAIDASTMRIEGIANERIALDSSRRALLASLGG